MVPFTHGYKQGGFDANTTSNYITGKSSTSDKTPVYVDMAIYSDRHSFDEADLGTKDYIDVIVYIYDMVSSAEIKHADTAFRIKLDEWYNISFTALLDTGRDATFRYQLKIRTTFGDGTVTLYYDARHFVMR